MTVSRVSRKTTKKTGTEKTWTVMVGGVALHWDERSKGEEWRECNEDENSEETETLVSQARPSQWTRVKRRAWAGEDQIMQKDLITAIKRDGGVLALACPCSAHPRVTDDPSDCGRKAEGRGTTSYSTAGRCSEGYANTAGGEKRIAGLGTRELCVSSWLFSHFFPPTPTLCGGQGFRAASVCGYSIT